MTAAAGRRCTRRWLPRTLRGRLIAGLVALLAVACASVGLVTYFAVQGALTRELNSQLQTATGLAYNCWERAGQRTTMAAGQRARGGSGPARRHAAPAPPRMPRTGERRQPADHRPSPTAARGSASTRSSRCSPRALAQLPRCGDPA